MDYYSRYIEVAKLHSTSADEVILHTKSVFARHGIPEQVLSDNGPQYSSEAYTQFAQLYSLTRNNHPYFPQSNREAESAVQTIKNLMRKKDDLYLAYRTTPTEIGYSPVELLMSRKLRTTVPMLPELRKPAIVDPSLVAEARQKRNFDERHGTRELSLLLPGDTVWVTDRQSSATVTEKIAPRSYAVDMGDGTFRRNRRYLLTSLREMNDSDTPDQSSPDSLNASHLKSDQELQTRSGKLSKPPQRLNINWS